MRHTSVIFTLILIILNGISIAQNNGAIIGKLIDKTTKQPLAGANVIVLENDNNITNYGSMTDENGLYLIKNIPENIYKLKISYIGYNTYIEPDIRVIRDKTFYAREIEIAELPIAGKEVVITSGYFNEDKEMPVSNYSYTREEIIRAPGSMGDIFRAVETLPGVSTSGGEFSSFSVRGDTPRDNIILIDNIPFSETSHFSETGGNLEIQGGRLSIFSQGMIDKAEFQSGGFSSKYGGRRASLLKLNIKEGNKESPSLNGSLDLTGFELNYDGPAFIDKSTSILFSARKIDFGTVLKIIGDEGDGNSNFSDFVLKTTSEINSSNKLSLLGIYSTEKHNREPYHYFKGSDILELELADQTEDKTLLGINWRTLTGTKGFLNTSVYYSRLKQFQESGEILTDPVYNRKPLQSETSVRYPIYIYNIDEKQTGFKSDFTYSFSNHLTLNAGLSIQQINADLKSTLNGQDTLYVFRTNEKTDNNFLIVTPEEFNSRFNKKRTEYAAYIETSISPSERFNINAGIRYDRDDLNTTNYLSPRFSGWYKLNEITSINFAAGIYYQPPSIRQIGFNDYNIKLKNEKSYHFILGVNRYLTDNLKFSAEGYYKKLTNLIVEPNSANNFAENIGSGYSYGFDFSLIKRFVDNYYGQINYSFSNCKLKDNSKSIYRYSDFNQPHMFNILFGYQLNANWSFSVKWKYAAGRPKDEFIIHSDVLNNENKMRYSKEIISENTKRYSDFHSLNFRVDYRKQFASYLAVNIFIDIMNLYDRANEVYEIFEPTAGLNKFSSMGFLPTIGIRIEI